MEQRRKSVCIYGGQHRLTSLIRCSQCHSEGRLGSPDDPELPVFPYLERGLCVTGCVRAVISEAGYSSDANSAIGRPAFHV